MVSACEPSQRPGPFTRPWPHFSWHYHLRPRPLPLPRPRPRRPPCPRPRLVGEPPEAVWLGILGANIPGTRPQFTLKGVLWFKF